ncbi:MAG TPA: cytochrome c/FTR1 family iron permease [Vicinamibacteria bacterium]|nr:cytochrome c/FTR1 family iron permease [Vicinamibacteria bacterium]
MKFVFIKKGALLAGLAAVCACGPGRARPALPGSSGDGGRAQRLVALVDYVGGDYKRAVQDGRVVSDAEYEEQVRFAADALRIAGDLLGKEAEAGHPLLARLREIQARVEAKADPAAVAAACRTAREEVVGRFRLRTMPSGRPDLLRAQDLYAVSCAKCHGLDGNADTERARELDPRPAQFKDPARLGELSPYRIYNTLTFGVRGTAMASFEDLPPADRWSLAFYVFRLAHEGEAAEGPVAMTLADMAARTDREILDLLRAESHPAPEKALVHVRREAAFTEPPAGVGIDRTRAMLRQAVDAYAAQQPREADALVIDSYLLGFEPLEPRLRARDAAGALEVEAGFRDLRAAVAEGRPADEVRARAQVLDRRLVGLGEGRRPLVPFVAAFVIYFREGIEAALLVGALLAGLRRLGREDSARFIHFGWLLALPAGIATYWLFDRALAVGADRRELLEAGIALVAAAVLFSVSFWMISKAEATRWMAFLKHKLESGLTHRSLYVLSGLAFLAVYREAAETILFTQALLLESATHHSEVWLGAAIGLLACAVVAVLMNRTVLRLPIGPFFAVSSALLCALAVSFAGAGMYALVAAGYLPPRPVSFPEITWMGIHPDLTSLLVQLTIVSVIVGAGLLTLRRRDPTPERSRS